MAEEFEGDLSGSVFWGADLRDARFRDVDLSGTRISHAWMVDVEIDALVDRLVVNGVDVTDQVNAGDPWYPLRAMIRADEPEAMRAAWTALEEAWSATRRLADGLPEAALHESVDGEWSWVETMRHLVFATDKWFTVPLAGGTHHRIGLPNSGSIDEPWPGIDRAAAPDAAEAMAAREERAAAFGRWLATVTAEDLAGTVEVQENGTEAVVDCARTVFEEEFWHNRYARRDIERLLDRRN